MELTKLVVFIAALLYVYLALNNTYCIIQQHLRLPFTAEQTTLIDRDTLIEHSANY